MDILFFKINAGRLTRDDLDGRLGKLAHLPRHIQRVEQNSIIILGNCAETQTVFFIIPERVIFLFQRAV